MSRGQAGDQMCVLSERVEWSQARASSLSAPPDWESLQLGGMIFGGLLCIAGILIALSEWSGHGAGHGGGCGVAQVPQVLCTYQLFLSQVENANASTIRSTGETGPLLYALGAEHTSFGVTSCNLEQEDSPWVASWACSEICYSWIISPEVPQIRESYNPCYCLK